jgi:hypothetical protein
MEGHNYGRGINKDAWCIKRGSMYDEWGERDMYERKYV